MRLFAITIFLGAFLLFQVQPLIGKIILPRFGSAPAVWTTCLLFFQVLLLGGYAYAHLLVGKLPIRAQAITHAVLLAGALALLPITPSEIGAASDGSDPTWPILVLLAASVGLPYLMLSATGPLLQAWFARAHPGPSPYRLYALSNAGSLLALVTYPFVVEPFVGLDHQTIAWSVAFAVFAVSCAACARVSARAGAATETGASPEPTEERGPGVSPIDVALWVALSACGAGLLMATTNRLCMDMVIVPFMWILPLAIYLLTFILCFDSDRWYVRPVFCVLLPLALATAGVYLHKGVHETLATQVAVGAGTLFVCLMGCHGELARLRPRTRHLTFFYLMIAAGGALGGLFVAVVAPVIFDGIWEYPLLLFACYGFVLFAALRAVRKDQAGLPGSRTTAPSRTLWWVFVGVTALLTVLYFDSDRWLTAKLSERDTERLDTVLLVSLGVAVLILGVTVVGAFRARSRKTGWLRLLLPGVCCLGLVPLAGILGWQLLRDRQHVVERGRNFYGTLRIEGNNEEGKRDLYLVHGRVKHGFQNHAPDVRAWPTSYYGPFSGVGLAIRRHPERRERGRSFRIGVVGLGVGTLAAYGNADILPDVGRPPYARARPKNPGDRIVFYEINPLVDVWSRRYFTFQDDAELRGATVETYLGDARIVMEQQLSRGEAQAFDVLAIDAFNSDAVPIHLLTNECFQTYVAHLAADGVLAYHISNLHLDLAPVVHRLAQHNGWASVFLESGDDEEHGVRDSIWILVTRNEAFLEVPEVASGRRWSPAKGPLWTDDFSSVLPLLKSRR